MKKYVTAFFTLLLPLFIAIGCDDIVRDNPVNLDTSGSFEFAVETKGVSFDETIRANLQAVVSSMDIGSGDLNLYNISIQAVNTGSTPDDVRISGELAMSRAGSGVTEPLANFTDVELSRFTTGHSIFTDEFEGIEPQPDGLQSVVLLFNENPLPTVDFTVSGEIHRPEGAPQTITMDIIVTVYVQVVESI